MASLVQEEEGLTSLDREDIFIADTTTLAKLFFEVQYNRKAEDSKQFVVFYFLIDRKHLHFNRGYRKGHWSVTPRDSRGDTSI